MFILDADQIPTTADELTNAIISSLKKSIKLPPNAVPVKITGALPNLSAIAVDISRGEVDTSQPLPDSKAPKNAQPGPTAESFTISGDPVVVGTIPIQLFLSAKQAIFSYARNKSGQLVASPSDAKDGSLSIHILKKPLDLGLLSIARQYASKHGVDIVKVESTTNSISPTDVKLLLKITAKKFMTAVIEISGRLQIDDRMIATATNLKAASSGMVGTVAVNMLQPQLTKLEGRPLPLMSFSMGNLKLRGVAVDTSDGLRLTASFGSELS